MVRWWVSCIACGLVWHSLDGRWPSVSGGQRGNNAVPCRRHGGNNPYMTSVMGTCSGNWNKALCYVRYGKSSCHDREDDRSSMLACAYGGCRRRAACYPLIIRGCYPPLCQLTQRLSITISDRLCFGVIFSYECIKMNDGTTVCHNVMLYPSLEENIATLQWMHLYLQDCELGLSCHSMVRPIWKALVLVLTIYGPCWIKKK